MQHVLDIQPVQLSGPVRTPHRRRQGPSRSRPCDGVVWVTQADDPRDIILSRGQSFILDRKGLAVVYALKDAAIVVGAAGHITAAAVRSVGGPQGRLTCHSRGTHALPDPSLSGRPHRRGAAWPAAGAWSSGRCCRRTRTLTDGVLRRPAGAGPLRPLHEPDAQPAAGPAQALHQRRLRGSPGPGGRGVRGRPRDRGRRGALRARQGSIRRPSSPCRWPRTGRAKGSPACCWRSSLCQRRDRRRRAHGRRDAGHQRQACCTSPARPASPSGRSPDVRGVMLLEKAMDAAEPAAPCGGVEAEHLAAA